MKEGKRVDAFLVCLVFIVFVIGFIEVVSSAIETRIFNKTDIYNSNDSKIPVLPSCPSPCADQLCGGRYWALNLTAKALCKLKGYDNQSNFDLKQMTDLGTNDYYIKKSSDGTNFEDACPVGFVNVIDNITCTRVLVTTECNDRIDNDNDGGIDALTFNTTSLTPKNINVSCLRSSGAKYVGNHTYRAYLDSTKDLIVECDNSGNKKISCRNLNFNGTYTFYAEEGYRTSSDNKFKEYWTTFSTVCKYGKLIGVCLNKNNTEGYVWNRNLCDATYTFAPSCKIAGNGLRGNGTNLSPMNGTRLVADTGSGNDFGVFCSNGKLAEFCNDVDDYISSKTWYPNEYVCSGSPVCIPYTYDECINYGLSCQTDKCSKSILSTECNDRIDNDLDGLIDLNDLGCNSTADTSEFQHDLECNNSNDNDESPYQVCPDNQTIMKLSSTTNATGFLWNKTSLSLTLKRVCFNQIFGKNFTDFTGNPHQCTGKNKVLELFEPSNSLAEIPENNNYNISVCYGDLLCRSVNTSEESCSSNEKTIVSLLSKTNSNLSLGDNSNYKIKICCRTGLDISESSWRSVRDELINKSDLNDLVKLDVRGKGFEGDLINYTIFKEDGGFLFFDKKITETSSRGFLKIRVGSINNFTEGKYYFKAKVGVKELDSRKKLDNTDNPFGILTVSNIEKNSMPIADIITPEDKGIYFLDEQLSFTQNSYDEDDEISYEWNLGDGTTKSGNSTNLADYSFNYTYTGESGLGQKNINLVVIDERGLKNRDQISILIVNSSYVLAYIDKPIFGEAFGKLVDFDATSSYFVEVKVLDDGCTRNITCKAGSCPNQTKGCPPCYKDNPALINSCPIAVDNSPQPLDSLGFSWIFDDNVNNNFSASGLAGAISKKIFARIGNHIVKLTVSINPSSSTETSFNVFFSNDTCFIIKDEKDKKFISGSSIGESYWVNPSATSSNSINNCYNPEGVDGNGDLKTECCPFGYTCSNTSSPAKCIFEPRDRCKDFTTKNNCLDDNSRSTIAIKELDPIIDKGKFVGGCEGFNEPYGNLCYQYLSCMCEWNSINNTCQPVSKHKVSHVTTNKIENFDYDNLPSNISSTCNSQGEPTTGKCVFEFTYSGSCLDGDEFVIRSWTAFFETNAASASNPDYCVDGSDSIPCEKVVKLEFFNFVNLIITILTLIVIYFLLNLRRKSATFM